MRWISSTTNVPCRPGDGLPRSLLWQLVGQLWFLGPSGLFAQNNSREQHEQVGVAPLRSPSPCVLWSRLPHPVLHPATQPAPRQPNPWVPGIPYPNTSTTRAPGCDSANATERPWTGMCVCWERARARQRFPGVIQSLCYSASHQWMPHASSAGEEGPFRLFLAPGGQREGVPLTSCYEL